MKTAGARSWGQLRKLRSGRFQASYWGPDKVLYRAPCTFLTKQDGSAWLSRQQSDISKGIWISPTTLHEETALSTITVGEYLEIFLKSRVAGGKLLKPSTVDLYRRLMRTKLQALSGLPVGSISSVMVRDWYSDLISDGRLTSAAKAYKLLKSIMATAQEDGVISSNPCQLRGAQTASTGKKISVPTPEEVSLIAEAVPHHYKLGVWLAAYGGLRFGELAALRRGDLQVAEGPNSGLSISVTKSISYVGGRFLEVPPKSRASVRKVSLNSNLLPKIQEHLSHFSEASQDELLIPSSSGGYLRNDVFAKAIRRACKTQGIDKPISPHGLRHFAATHLARAGANLPELKAWLGDSSSAAAIRYLHTTDRTESLVEKMVFRS